MLVLALATLGVGGCHRSKPREKAASVAVKKSPAELQRLAESARKSLDGLQAPVAALRARIQELHKEFDPLPPGLPGFGETRSEFYAAAEGVGMLHAKLSWLSGRIDSAEKSGDGAELEQVSKEIERTYQDVTNADKMSIGLIHKVQPFKTAHEPTVQEVLGKGKCE